jgi:hypothetical protein
MFTTTELRFAMAFKYVIYGAARGGFDFCVGINKRYVERFCKSASDCRFARSH